MELAAIIKYAITLFTFLLIGLISISYIMFRIKNRSTKSRDIVLSERPDIVSNKNLKFKVVTNIDN